MITRGISLAGASAEGWQHQNHNSKADTTSMTVPNLQ